jgi:hypothetical protein
MHNQQLHNLSSSPDTMKVINSRRIREARHVTHMGHMSAYKISITKPEAN